MLEASKEERTEIYRDSRFQRFLNKFFSGELDKLIPVYNQKYGCRYPQAEVVIGDPATTLKFLNRLYELGFLKRELYDKTIHCPVCDSANASTRYRCPYCRTFGIKKSSLIEHVSCGYIAVEERFSRQGKLMCPKCGAELAKPDVDYRKAGVWCSCGECGKSFDIPVPSHFCRECHMDFMFEDASYRSVYSYSLDEAVMKEAKVQYTLVAPIKGFLEKNGFRVQSPGFLKGKSGASHLFHIVASSEKWADRLITIDVVSSPTREAVSEQSIISMFAKVFDVAPYKACLIAIPKMSEDGRRLADLYKIRLIEAEDQGAAIRALEASMCHSVAE